MKTDTSVSPSIKKHDWLVIEQDYVTGPEKPSLRSLEQRYGCSHSVLQRHAAKGEWFKKREEHWHKVGTNAAQKIAESQSERLSRHLEYARYGEQKCIEAMRTGKVRFSPGDLHKFILLERELYGETNYTEAFRHDAEQKVTHEEAAAFWKAMAMVRAQEREQSEL